MSRRLCGHSPPEDERESASGHDWLDEWLVARAVEGLDPDDEAELRELLNVDDVDHGHYEQAAACFWLGAGDPARAMPPDVAARVERAIAPPEEEPSGDAGGRAESPAPAAWGRPVVGALARRGPIGTGLAAALVLAAGAAWWTPDGMQSPERDDLADARSELLADAPDAVRIDWERAESPEGVPDASGYVVWSDARQRGYLTFRDIPANDPEDYRYHAWLFPNEDPATPIRIGAFDAPEDSGEVVVPIDERLPVLEAERFGLTRAPAEEPSYSESDDSLLFLAEPSAGDT